MRKKKQRKKSDQPKVFTVPRVASFLLIVAAAMSSATILFTATGKPQFPLWMTAIAVVVFVVVTFFMGRLIPMVPSWVRYLLDVVVGLSAGFAFVCSEESTLPDGLGQNFLTYFVLAVIFIAAGTYFGKHHPRETDAKSAPK